MPEPLLYPTYISWKVDLLAVSDVASLLGPERVRKIKKAIERLHAGAPNHLFLIEAVTPNYLDEFVPLYESHIGAKERGTVFDVRSRITEKMAKGFEYEAVSLRADGRLLGGMIYGVRPHTMSVAYRVFPLAMPLKLPISCSYIAEQLLIEKALALHKRSIIHGKDRNPYGVYSSIGLAGYKLTIGCVPYVSSFEKTTFLPLDEKLIAQPTLIFLGSAMGDKISRGLLFATEAELQAGVYGAVLKQSRVQVETRVLLIEGY